MKYKTQITYFLLVTLIFSIKSFSQSNQNLIIGTKVAEPFSVKDSNNNWSGVSFELWNIIADELDYEYSVLEFSLDSLIHAVKIGKIDAAIAPLTITSDREKILDFTQPYFITGLGIAVQIKSGHSFWQTAKNLFSFEFLNIVGILSLLLFAVGFVTWLFERKKNKEQFGDGISKGLGSSFWWAAVTMTTVGYGDKTPKTFGGRLIGLLWMFAAIIIISSFTAAIASSLTINRLGSNIKSLNDLYSARVGTIAHSSSEEFLKEKQINYITFNNAEEAIYALNQDEIDAVVHDSPILKYIIKKKGLKNILGVLPKNLELIYYGFALPFESKYYESINVSLLNKINSKEWGDIKFRYFGE